MIRLSNSKFHVVEPGRHTALGRLRQEAKGRQAGLIRNIRIVDQQCADEHVRAGEAVREHRLNGSAGSRRQARPGTWANA